MEKSYSLSFRESKLIFDLFFDRPRPQSQESKESVDLPATPEANVVATKFLQSLFQTNTLNTFFDEKFARDRGGRAKQIGIIQSFVEKNYQKPTNPGRFYNTVYTFIAKNKDRILQEAEAQRALNEAAAEFRKTKGLPDTYNVVLADNARLSGSITAYMNGQFKNSLSSVLTQITSEYNRKNQLVDAEFVRSKLNEAIKDFGFFIKNITTDDDGRISLGDIVCYNYPLAQTASRQHRTTVSAALRRVWADSPNWITARESGQRNRT